MKQEEDKWLEKLRHRMEDYSEPVPQGLWADIEKDLPDAPKVVPLWRRWQAVAAIALLVVVSSLTVWLVHSPVVPYMEEQSTRIAEVAPVAAEETEIPLPVEEKVIPKVKEKPLIRAVAKQFIPHEEAEKDTLLPPEVMKEDTVSAPQTSPKRETERKEDARPPQRKPMYGHLLASSKKRSSAWSVGVSVGNGALSLGNGNGSSLAYDMFSPNFNSPDDTQSPDSVGQTPDEGEERRVLSRGASRAAEMDYGAFEKRHHTPFVVGMSVRWMLDEAWALESGLTYTRLVTDLAAGNLTGEQKLHYIGIPLKVSRKVWADRRWSVYAAAGGAVEKCVSGQLTFTEQWKEARTKEKLDIDELQWSLQASVGVQYRLAGQLGIYAEPGVSYYFDDGSGVETIRKEKPFHFNLQVGLRLTLPK
ncbi:MAG: outer membrane beta-barrel protein [Bacteroides sp.]|nr:outer membrane beta-barrel protein [Bacteroides sp.]